MAFASPQRRDPRQGHSDRHRRRGGFCARELRARLAVEVRSPCGLGDEPNAADRPDLRRALHSNLGFWKLTVVYAIFIG
jgi:hypothetical protein